LATEEGSSKGSGLATDGGPLTGSGSATDGGQLLESPSKGPVDSAIQQSIANRPPIHQKKSVILHWISLGTYKTTRFATHGIMESYFHIEKQEMLEAAKMTYMAQMSNVMGFRTADEIMRQVDIASNALEKTRSADEARKKAERELQKIIDQIETFITSAIETATKVLKEHFDQVVLSKVAEAMAVINDGRPNKHKADDDVGYSCSKRLVAAESAQPMEGPRQDLDLPPKKDRQKDLDWPPMEGPGQDLDCQMTKLVWLQQQHNSE
jgi:hypothetical protein